MSAPRSGLFPDPLPRDGVPVSGEVVALLRLPMRLDAILGVTNALEATYGKGLVIRTDQTQADGWMAIAKPTEEKH